MILDLKKSLAFEIDSTTESISMGSPVSLKYSAQTGTTLAKFDATNNKYAGVIMINDDYSRNTNIDNFTPTASFGVSGFATVLVGGAVAVGDTISPDETTGYFIKTPTEGTPVIAGVCVSTPSTASGAYIYARMF